jgi:hypothetical protein
MVTLKGLQRVLCGVSAVAVGALWVVPAIAAGTPAAMPDLTPMVTSTNSMMGEGIAFMMGIAPWVIAAAVVWGVIRKARGMAK